MPTAGVLGGGTGRKEKLGMHFVEILANDICSTNKYI